MLISLQAIRAAAAAAAATIRRIVIPSTTINRRNNRIRLTTTTVVAVATQGIIVVATLTALDATSSAAVLAKRGCPRPGIRGDVAAASTTLAADVSRSSSPPAIAVAGVGFDRAAFFVVVVPCHAYSPRFQRSRSHVVVVWRRHVFLFFFFFF